jgi:hypothetical protein
MQEDIRIGGAILKKGGGSRSKRRKKKVSRSLMTERYRLE